MVMMMMVMMHSLSHPLAGLNVVELQGVGRDCREQAHVTRPERHEPKQKRGEVGGFWVTDVEEASETRRRERSDGSRRQWRWKRK